MGAQTIADYTAVNIHIESIDPSYQVGPDINVWRDVLLLGSFQYTFH